MKMSDSLYLSHVKSSISMESIAEIFHLRGIGNVERIEWLPHTRTYGVPYRMCFVYFYEWYDTIESISLRRDIDAKRNKKGSAQFAHFVCSKNGFFWTIAINNTRISQCLPARHIELEMSVPEYLDYRTICLLFDQLNIGKVSNIELK